MKNQQGFSLVELLIVVAIIAIIAAIAVPSLLTSRMATNEAAAIQGCRTLGSAQIAYSATNNQSYASIPTLVTGNFLDSRFDPANGGGVNGYTYTEDSAITSFTGPTTVATGGFGFVADSQTGAGRYKYGIAPDQVVRYMGLTAGQPDATPPAGLNEGDPIGKVVAAP